MIPLHVFHATHFEGDSFTYCRPQTYQPKDTSIIFSQYIREKVSNQFGLDIHNCLYAYSNFNDFAKENFGNNVFSVNAEKADFRAFISKDCKDITYDYKIGSGHLLASIYNLIDSITYGQLPASSFVTNDMMQHLNNKENDFLSFNDFKSFLRKIHNNFNKECAELNIEENIYDQILKEVDERFQKINDEYLKKLTEISLPYYGDEEIIIVADKLYLEKTAIE